jgi:hypothetical protein
MEQERLKELVVETAKLMGVEPEEITLVHVSETPKPCDHDWDNDGCNPEYCLKCGISFMRYAFTEMP